MVLLYGGYRLYGYWDLCTRPFRIYTEEEARSVLTEIGSNNCDTFIARYITAPPQSSFAVFIRGVAYDKGLCVPQDLDKAVEYYERSVIWYHPIISPILRLALIYKYGPHHLHDSVRAEYLFRQAAIAFVPFDNSVRYTYIDKSSNSTFIPGALKSELSWLDKHMMKNGTEGQHLALEMREEGYDGATGLWSELTPGRQQINLEKERARIQRQNAAAAGVASPNYEAPMQQRPAPEPIPGIDDSDDLGN
jgi:hypothetical protein